MPIPRTAPTGPLRRASDREPVEDSTRGALAMARQLGEDVMGCIGDPDVTELYVNPDGTLRLDTRSRGKVEAGPTLAPHKVEMFLNVVADLLGATLGRDTPLLEAELPRHLFRGARLMGFVAPVVSGPCFCIRIPARQVYTLEDLVSQGVVTSVQGEVFGRAIAEHWNVVVAGATGSGKSTLVNAMIDAIRVRFPRERLVVLEDTVELQCSARDHLALRTGRGATLQQLVRSTMRASPNRVIVGEVRGVEALDLLDVWATGHPGGCATLHASSVLGALNRLNRLARRANVPSQKTLIAEAIHLVAVMRGGNSGRRVAELARICGLDARGRYVVHHLTPTEDVS